MSLAPVALFAFKRPVHTARALRALLGDPLIRETRVFVFCDGPHGSDDAELVRATRDAVRMCGIPKLQVTERHENLGLARSVISGVSELCATFGRVIVLEDDLVPSSTFLSYMNSSLERYREDDRVYHVSAYMYPVRLPRRQDAVFLPFVNSWGWATWERAWRFFDPDANGFEALRKDPDLRLRFDLDGSFRFFDMLQLQQDGCIDSWFIRWYLSVFLRGGLGLFPTRSLVANTGFGETATHTKAAHCQLLRATAHLHTVRAFPEPCVDARAYRRIKLFLRWDLALPVRATRKLFRILRSLVHHGP